MAATVTSSLLHRRETLRSLVVRLRENLIDFETHVDDCRQEIINRHADLDLAVDQRNRTARDLAQAIADLASVEQEIKQAS